MSWIKRIVRSPIWLQVLVVMLQLAAQFIKQAERKKPKK